MQEYSENTNLDSIIESRKAKFQKMGIPAPVASQREIEQMVGAGTGKNASTRDRINAIKNGQRRSEIKEFIQAKSGNEKNMEFEKMTESTSRNRNSQQRQGSPIQSKVAPPPLAKFDVQGEKLGNIDAMFDDGPGYGGNIEDVVMGNSWNQRKQDSLDGPLVSENYVTPTSNWEDQFSQRVSSHRKSAPQSEFLQYATTTPQNKNNYVNAPEFINESQNYSSVERIVNEMVDKKMSILLAEIVRMQQKPEVKDNKNILTYKKVNNKKGETIKDMISIDGKFYKLEEVKVGK
jgi:hypothetical protein